MAAYFHGGSEIQADGLQTLYLMNPNYVGYTDTQQPAANMLFMNSSAARNGLHPGSHLHAPPPNGQHFEGVPLQVKATAVEPTNQVGASRLSVHTQQEVPVLHGIGVIPRFQYNLWGSADQTSTGNHQHIPPAVSIGCGNHAMDVTSQLGFLKPVVSPTTQQGLSLTLSSQQPGYQSLSTDQDLRVQLPAGFISPKSGDELRCSGGGSSSVSAVSTGISCMQSVIMSSKYLKATQQLLDEFVHVGKGMKNVMDMAGTKETMNMNKETMAFTGENSSGGENSTKPEIELPTAQRHELQMNKAKLGNMLDEVKQRYRQYHHQMQIVVAAFEQVAGIGSAQSYTHLALQTISKQFRCLKDAISSQIKATSKRLGEEDSLEGKIERSRLKFVDHQLRQQKALQQLGMMQQNAWRAQRGLPERAVSVLRAWLFEHFLHPYPKDSDKHTLAKQTGLTKSQVSNWFINARVRLWKPMVEEMYVEEMKENEKNNVTEENISKCDQNKESSSKSSVPKESSGFQMDENSRLQAKQAKLMNQNHASPKEISTCSMTTSPTAGYFHAQAGFSFMGSTNFDGISQRSPKKLRSSDMLNSAESILPIDMDMKSGETNKGLLQDRESYPMMEGTATHHGNGFGTYTIGELGRFNPDQLAAGYLGSGVSLTLGLPHTENNNLSSISRNQHSYLSNQNIHLGSRHEMGTVETHYSGINTTPQASHSNTTSFETINNIQNRKNFAAQLLPDFVA